MAPQTPLSACPHRDVEVHMVGDRCCVICIRCLAVVGHDIPMYVKP